MTDDGRPTTSQLLDPGQPDLLHPLAYCLLRLEWWKEAADTLQGLVSVRPSDAMAWARLGAAYRQMGRTAEGAHALAKGLELGYDEPWVWFEPGLAAATLDDRPALEKARDVLKGRDAALARTPEDRIRGLASTAPSDGCQRPAAGESTSHGEVSSC
jgi:tetratricopeptide (TPR) repeat protein